MSESSPLRRQGWDLWSYLQMDKASISIPMPTGTYLQEHELQTLATIMKALSRTMAHIQALEVSSHFHGWFPSGYIPRFLSDFGVIMTDAELDTAISVAQTFPIAPHFPPEVPVPIMIVLTVPIQDESCFFGRPSYGEGESPRQRGDL